MRLGWGHDDGAFFFSRPDAAQQECCEPGFTLLCMGLFSQFFVQALPCTAEGTVCRVRDTRSLVPRAYGTNRSNSNTSCSRARSRDKRNRLSGKTAPHFCWIALKGLKRVVLIAVNGKWFLCVACLRLDGDLTSGCSGLGPSRWGMCSRQATLNLNLFCATPGIWTKSRSGNTLRIVITTVVHHSGRSDSGLTGA